MALIRGKGIGIEAEFDLIHRCRRFGGRPFRDEADDAHGDGTGRGQENQT